MLICAGLQAKITFDRQTLPINSVRQNVGQNVDHTRMAALFYSTVCCKLVRRCRMLGLANFEVQRVVLARFPKYQMYRWRVWLFWPEFGGDFFWPRVLRRWSHSKCTKICYKNVIQTCYTKCAGLAQLLLLSDFIWYSCIRLNLRFSLYLFNTVLSLVSLRLKNLEREFGTN